MRVLLTLMVAASISQPGQPVFGQPAAPPPERTYSLDVRQLPLRQAVARLFRDARVNYAVDPGVRDVPVTVVFHDLPLEGALETLVHAASTQLPGLTYDTREGFFFVLPGEPRGAGAERLADAIEPRWEKLPLHNLDAAQLAIFFDWPIFPGPYRTTLASDFWFPYGGGAQPGFDGSGPSRGGTPVRKQPTPAPQEANPSADRPPRPPYHVLPSGGLYPPGLIMFSLLADNSVIVRGTPDDIVEFRRLLGLMDAPRPQYRVRLSTGATFAEGVVLNDTRLSLTDAALGERMSITATPRLTGAGAIELTLSGTITANGVTHPVDARVRLRLGRAAQLFSFGSGRRPVRLWARVDLFGAPGE